MSEERLLLWSYLIFSVWAAANYLGRRRAFGTRFLVSIVLVACLSAAGLLWPPYRHVAFLAATAGFVVFLLLPGLIVGIARRVAARGRFGVARRLLSLTLLVAPSTFLTNERDLYRAAEERDEIALGLTERIRARHAVSEGPLGTRVCIAIALVVTVVHAIASILGDTQSPLTLLTLGANHLPLVREGEWYRLVSSMFLHAGFLHLFLNATAIWIVGRWVEPKLGASRTLIIFVLGGLAGSAVSLAASAQAAFPIPSVGASGGALALLGAVIPITMQSPAGAERSMRLQTLVVIIGATFFLGFMEPAIDDGAHLGGLLSGAILGLVFIRRPWPDGPVRVLAIVVIVGVGVATVQAVRTAIRWSAWETVTTEELTFRHPGFVTVEERPDGWHLRRPPLADAHVTVLSCPVGSEVPPGFTAVPAPEGWTAFRGLRMTDHGPELEYVFRGTSDGTGRMAHLRFLLAAEDPLLVERFVTPVVQSFRFR